MITLPRLTALLGVAAVSCLVSSAMALSPDRIYDSIPNKLPGNVVSLGFEATTAKEFGDGLVFTTGSGGAIHEVSVVLSSWGCVAGHWNSDDCVTPVGRRFKHPITLNIYEVETGGPNGPDGFKIGDLLYTATETFNIPYRPSVDHTHCTGGRWYSNSEKTCYNGFAAKFAFKLPPNLVAVPERAIVTFAYNTTHYGYSPIGEGAACYSSSGGCPYDSLNVSADGDGGPIGGVVDSNGTFVNYALPSQYCSPHVYEGDVAQIDTTTDPCGWAGYHPQIEVQAMDRHKQLSVSSNRRARSSR